MELWAVCRYPVVILPEFRLPRKFRDLLHAANLRHGTDGFTSPPKEGVLRIFFALKIRRLRPGLNFTNLGRAETECDGTRKRMGGEVKGKKANGGVASSRALYRTRSIQHYYR